MYLQFVVLPLFRLNTGAEEAACVCKGGKTSEMTQNRKYWWSNVWQTDQAGPASECESGSVVKEALKWGWSEVQIKLYKQVYALAQEPEKIAYFIFVEIPKQ